MKIDLYKNLSFLFLLCITTLFACSDDDEGSASQQLATDQAIIEDFLTDNGLSAQLSDQGFFFNPIVTNENGRAINPEDIVSIYYTLSILGGQGLHAVQAPDDPLQVLFGGFSVVPVALEAALAEMKEGEVFEFYMPSNFSYGNYTFQTLIPELAITRMQISVVQVNDAESQREVETNRILTYIEDQGLEGEEARENGLYYVQTEPGEGDLPNNFQNISVNYTGTFLDGTKFDSSFDRNEPLTFQLGAGQVIPGWDLGFKDLRKGEKGILFIPSHLAYGANFYVAPPDITQDLINQRIIPVFFTEIPPFATLVFEVEIVDIL